MAPVKTIAVIIAMKAEAAPLVEHPGEEGGAEPFPGPIPAEAQRRRRRRRRARVLQRRGQGLRRRFRRHRPGGAHRLPNLRTPQARSPDQRGHRGGLQGHGGAIGDVYLATAFKNHDRRIPIPGFDAYGVGHADAAPCPALRQATDSSPVVSTGNSLDAPDVDVESLKKNEASVKEMEAAASHTCAPCSTSRCSR